MYLLTAIFWMANWYILKFIDIESLTSFDYHIGSLTTICVLVINMVIFPIPAHFPDYGFSKSQNWMRFLQISWVVTTTMIWRYHWISQLASCCASKPVPDITPLPVGYAISMIFLVTQISFYSIIFVSFSIVQNCMFAVFTWIHYIVGKKEI